MRSPVFCGVPYKPPFLDSDDMIAVDTLHYCNEAFTQQNMDVVLFG